MKALVAQFIFESNTFNAAEAGISIFTEGGLWLTETSQIAAWARTAPSQTSGSIAVLEAAGWTAVPVFAGLCGSPAGRLSAACFGQIRRELKASVVAALPADLLVLHLHGAACAAGEDDVEGNLLAMLREEVGFQGRIALSLDLHANVTQRMLAHADMVTAYRTMPHTDFVETGARVARLALAAPAKTCRVLAKIAALIPPTDTNDLVGRFAAILQEARLLEQLPGICDISLFPVQPWVNVAELGSSVVVTAAEADASAALDAARRLATRWYAQRDAWQTGLRPWSEIKAVLRGPKTAPWFLVDTADATSGGSPGCSAEVVRELLPLAGELPGEVLLCVVDAGAVAAAEAEQIHFRLGDPPVELTASARYLGGRHYRARGLAYTGQSFSMGRAAILTVGTLRIVVTTAPALVSDPAFYECLGLVPDEAHAVHVKSLMGWRAGYEVGPDRGLPFDGPGSTSLAFSRLAFSGPALSVFPIDRDPSNPITLWQST